MFSGNEWPYRKEISGITLTMISIDYPQRLARGVGVREKGTAKDVFLLLRDSNRRCMSSRGSGG